MKGNTVLGRAGKNDIYDETDYYETFANTVEEATVENNFYTSILGGQRVTNELLYDTDEEKFIIEKGVRPVTVVSDTYNFVDSKEFVIRNKNGSIGFMGDEKDTTILDNNHLETEIPNVGTIITINGKKSVIDLPGIGHPYENNTISGRLAIDSNGNGILDDGDAGVQDVLIQGKLDNNILVQTITNANGNYSMNVPLINGFNDYDMNFSLSNLDMNGLVWSDSVDNDFDETLNLIRHINYTEDQMINGLLEETANPISIEIEDHVDYILVGESLQFNATVHNDQTNAGVKWSILNNTSQYTYINDDGLLIVGEDEKVTTLLIMAICNTDNDVFATTTIKVLNKELPVDPDDNEKPDVPTDPKDPVIPVEPEPSPDKLPSTGVSSTQLYVGLVSISLGVLVLVLRKYNKEKELH